MKIYKSQTGFAPLLLIGLLLFVGAAGFGGYKVYQAKKEADKSPQNTSTIQETEQQKQKTTLDSVSSRKCEYRSQEKIDIFNEWEATLKDTSEIQALETDKDTNVAYTTAAGSVCDLDSQSTLISFSHNKATTKSDNTIDSKLTYGLFVYSKDNVQQHSNTKLECKNIPPDPTNPPSVKSVSKGKVTLTCPGYQGSTFVYDFKTQVYTEQ